MKLQELAPIFLWMLVSMVINVEAHGRMMDPPQRSSMWRFGFNVEPNYNDNSLFCGGFGTQYNAVNQGRCGECGDEWSLPRPRLNDEGGIYGTGTIGKVYTEGEVSKCLLGSELEPKLKKKNCFRFS